MESTGKVEAVTVEIKGELVLSDPHQQPNEEIEQIFIKEENIKMEIPEDPDESDPLQLNDEDCVSQEKSTSTDALHIKKEPELQKEVGPTNCGSEPERVSASGSVCYTVNKCCFCIDLHVGIIAISSVWLLGNAIVLVWTSHLALVFNAALNDLESGVSLDAQAGVSFVMLTGAFWMAVVAAVLSGLAILLSIVLLAGAITARRKLLRGWMLAYAVLYGVVLVIGGLSVAAVFAFDYIVTGPCLALGLLLLVGLLVYFWIVVRSYYLELGQEYGEDGLRSIAEKV